LWLKGAARQHHLVAEEPIPAAVMAPLGGTLLVLSSVSLLAGRYLTEIHLPSAALVLVSNRSTEFCFTLLQNSEPPFCLRDGLEENDVRLVENVTTANMVHIEQFVEYKRGSIANGHITHSIRDCFDFFDKKFIQ
jgi:hypothetical protein